MREARGLALQTMGRHVEAVKDFSAGIATWKRGATSYVNESTALGFTASHAITPAALGEMLYHRAVSEVELGRAEVQ